MTFEREFSGWTFVFFNDSCPIVQFFVPGRTIARFDVEDPSSLGPATQSIVVLANEVGCNGGAPLGDRLDPPRVIYGTEFIDVLFTAEPLRHTGAVSCQGALPKRVVLELSEPLGDLKLRDLGNLPEQS